MQDGEEKFFKLRLKLKNGEEFEAEGPISFIESQKTEFLKLSAENTKGLSYFKRRPFPNISDSQDSSAPEVLEERTDGGASKTPLQENREAPPEGKYSPKTDIWGHPKIANQQPRADADNTYPGAPSPEPYSIPPSLSERIKKRQKNNAGAIIRPESSVWDRIAYCEDEYIILRRKDRSLNAALAALIILGCAKMLRNKTKMSALELSKSLKLSGYLKENERLDRVLSPEIKASSIVYEGSKRNRDYIITQSGTAKAYTSAERILLNG